MVYIFVVHFFLLCRLKRSKSPKSIALKKRSEKLGRRKKHKIENENNGTQFVISIENDKQITHDLKAAQ